ncbi:serine/threonine-protein kinase [Thermodesulfobacteriota bacterium]
MTENENIQKSQSTKMGLTRWLKGKFLGGNRDLNPVDRQFLEDLEDIETVGRYEIIRKLGQGSMGVVYLGKDPYINRNVSIKVARPAANVVGKKADRYRERFFLEAQSAGRLMHPNIVAIYDAGMYKDFCYITMEFIDGTTLENSCDKSNLLPIAKAAGIIIAACKALDYAHQQGVVHRDIKPSNIMLNKSEEVRITDFGIAKIKADQTISKGIIGSPSYMSPEQVKEEPVEDISDVFSLGCVLYELLTGEQAFPGDNYFSIMYKITNDNPAPLRNIRPEIPEILEKIAYRALAKDLNQRYQTCMDFAYDLRVALRGLKEEGVKKENVEDVIDYVGNVQFFNHFTKGQVQEILEAANVVKVSNGTVMVTEGEIDDSFYIILSGKAAVHKNNRVIATIGRGECFGEMAYLSGDSRTATVSAESDCILLKISAMLLDKSPQAVQLLFLKRFAMTLLRRLSVSISKFE